MKLVGSHGNFLSKCPGISENIILFYFILFYFILFYFHFIFHISYFISFRFVLFYLSYFISFFPILQKGPIKGRIIGLTRSWFNIDLVNLIHCRTPRLWQFLDILDSFSWNLLKIELSYKKSFNWFNGLFEDSLHGMKPQLCEYVILSYIHSFQIFC